MSQKYLKVKTLDIHGGGRDLIFPHHENEVAQSEALSGETFANYWIHHGLLTINKQKMAKSLGNFVTIKDILKKYPADILKVLYLGAHYGSSMDFSWEKMEEAKKAYERITILMDKLNKIENTTGGMGEEGMLAYKRQFTEAMDDDFNTAKALAVLFDLVGRCNKLLESDEKYKNFMLRQGKDMIKDMADIFGLNFTSKIPSQVSAEEIDEKIKLRLEYRGQKKFKEADSIRKELEDKGIILEDAPDGTTWRKKL